MKRIVLIILTLFLAFSCTKERVFEYDLESLEGKWLVTPAQQ